MSPSVSFLDALIAAAREADRSVHRATAHELRAVGLGVPGDVFERAAHTFAERVSGTDAAAGNRIEQILKRRWFDVTIDDRLRLRVVDIATPVTP